MLTGFRAYLLDGLMPGTPTRGWHARQRHEPPGDRGGGEERAVRAAVTRIGARYRSKGVRAAPMILRTTHRRATLGGETQ